jgi:hypothetical protein
MKKECSYTIRRRKRMNNTQDALEYLMGPSDREDYKDGIQGGPKTLRSH